MSCYCCWLLLLLLREHSRCSLRRRPSPPTAARTGRLVDWQPVRSGRRRGGCSSSASPFHSSIVASRQRQPFSIVHHHHYRRRPAREHSPSAAVAPTGSARGVVPEQCNMLGQHQHSSIGVRLGPYLPSPYRRRAWVILCPSLLA
ncbi:hypothetical protein BKA63DRAFT_250024 [Paraphoma chrysanthemicola]|nr:hypothetical protein BKA63DRAFT_250024 [Paraphoma chrysanthemicola]